MVIPNKDVVLGLRKSLGESKTKFAHSAGVSVHILNKLERGEMVLRSTMKHLVMKLQQKGRELEIQDLVVFPYPIQRTEAFFKSLQYAYYLDHGDGLRDPTEREALTWYPEGFVCHRVIDDRHRRVVRVRAEIRNPRKDIVFQVIGS